MQPFLDRQRRGHDWRWRPLGFKIACSRWPTWSTTGVPSTTVASHPLPALPHCPAALAHYYQAILRLASWLASYQPTPPSRYPDRRDKDRSDALTMPGRPVPFAGSALARLSRQSPVRRALDQLLHTTTTKRLRTDLGSLIPYCLLPFHSHLASATKIDISILFPSNLPRHIPWPAWPNAVLDFCTAVLCLVAVFPRCRCRCRPPPSSILTTIDPTEDCWTAFATTLPPNNLRQQPVYTSSTLLNRN